jgi:hypothetical protein
LDPLISWIVSLIYSVAPPVGYKTHYQPAAESREESKARYTDIATDIANVVYDPNEKPLFTGVHGRMRTALMVVSIFNYESHFRKDVDLGDGERARGDHGQSWCLGQVNLGRIGDEDKSDNKKGKKKRIAKPLATPEEAREAQRYRVFVDTRGHFGLVDHLLEKDTSVGWSGADLVENRENCIRATIAIARTSLAACRSNPLEFRLNLYTSGSCFRGHESSRKRIELAMSLYEKHHRRIKRDADILAERQQAKAQELKAATNNNAPMVAASP